VNDLPLEGFQKAIRATHGAESRLVERVRVDERFEGEPVWQGEVLVFDEFGGGRRFYCWEVDGRVTAVLHTGPIESPVKAVRASILAEE
jgi:hypothetical protein